MALRDSDWTFSANCLIEGHAQAKAGAIDNAKTLLVFMINSSKNRNIGNAYKVLPFCEADVLEAAKVAQVGNNEIQVPNFLVTKAVKIGCEPVSPFRASVQIVAVVSLFFLISQGATAGGDGISAEMSRAEKLYFGSTKDSLSAIQRLDALDNGLFGKPQPGTIIKRLSHIEQMLEITSVPSSKGSQVRFATRKPPKKTTLTPTVLTEQTHQKSGGKGVKTTSLSVQCAELPPVAPRAVLNTRQLLQLGAQRFKEGNAIAADAAFHQVLLNDPQNVDALYNLGALAEGRRDYNSALGFYNSALTIKPEDVDLKQAVASMQEQSGKFPTVQSDPSGKTLFGQANVSQAPFTAPQINSPLYPGQPALGAFPSLSPGQTSVRVGSPPVIGVTNPSPSSLAVNQPNHSSKTLRRTISTGMSLVPLPGPLGALHCPLCHLLNGN